MGIYTYDHDTRCVELHDLDAANVEACLRFVDMLQVQVVRVLEGGQTIAVIRRHGNDWSTLRVHEGRQG